MRDESPKTCPPMQDGSWSENWVGRCWETHCPEAASEMNPTADSACVSRVFFPYICVHRDTMKMIQSASRDVMLQEASTRSLISIWDLKCPQILYNCETASGPGLVSRLDESNSASRHKGLNGDAMMGNPCGFLNRR